MLENLPGLSIYRNTTFEHDNFNECPDQPAIMCRSLRILLIFSHEADELDKALGHTDQSARLNLAQVVCHMLRRPFSLVE